MIYYIKSVRMEQNTHDPVYDTKQRFPGGHPLGTCFPEMTLTFPGVRVFFARNGGIG